MSDTYLDFLKAKSPVKPSFGVPVSSGDIHESLKPHQRAIVQWAVDRGRAAIFAKFGLGKTRMQLEACRLVTPATDRWLIVCPLGVRAEFQHDAAEIGLPQLQFIRHDEQVTGPGGYITNYESIRDGKLTVDHFTTVSLDEAAVLRSFGSKTFNTFMPLFKNVKFRFVATATPSPNRYKELIHYGGFLGVMDTGQALTRFFQRDSTQANNLTLYPHKEREFWLWLSSWSVFLQSPADLGYDATGYDLPAHEVTYVEVDVDPATAHQFETNGQGAMFNAGGLGITQAAKMKRSTLDVRVGKAIEVAMEQGVADGEQAVIWCDLNDEQTAIEKALKARGVTYSSVHGSLDIDEVERRIAAWKNRDTAVLIGKPVQLGQGLNLQQCNLAVFVGLTAKFNQVIQAVHRIYRFGQTRTCRTFIVHADTERQIVGTIKKKWQKHEELTNIMSNLIREHGLNNIGINEELIRSLGVERVEVKGDTWTVVNNDCVIETRSMDDDSVGLIVTSIPFSNHYEYTPSYNDFGHTDNNDHFWAQMDYLTPNLLRILKPGRTYACHVKDRVLFGGQYGTGAPTISPFHAEALMHGMKHGFDFMGMITITTDVVRENNQGYRLTYGELKKDGSRMGVGSPEYVILFRKPQTDRTNGYADDPVIIDPAEYSLPRWQIDAHAYWRSDGERHITPEEWAALPTEQVRRLMQARQLESVYDHEAHVTIGETLDELGRLPRTFALLEQPSPDPDVWTDVSRMLTLNTMQSQRGAEKHVCPLQFDIVDRLIRRHSNHGDLVFDPFGGLSTVAVRAMRLGRLGRTVELNPNYFLDGVRYCQVEERKLNAPSLFDLMADEAMSAA